MNVYPPHTHCIVCGTETRDGDAFCSRPHALEQQRRTLGYTVAELAHDRTLEVKRGGVHHTNLLPFRQRYTELLRGWKRA